MLVLLTLATAGCAGSGKPSALVHDACAVAVQLRVPLENRGPISAMDSQLRVRVVDVQAGSPIYGALIAIFDDTVRVTSAITDRRGEAIISAPGDSYRFDVQRIGYRTTSSEVRLQPGRLYMAHVPMWQQPVC